MANELAAKFYLDWGKEKVAQAYMQEAYYCYARWGAKAKTDDLEKHYPELLQPILQSLQQQKTLFNVVNQIRESLNLDAIFRAVTQNIRSILNVSRVGIYQFHLGVNYEYGEFIAEDVLPQFPSGLAVKTVRDSHSSKAHHQPLSLQLMQNIPIGMFDRRVQ